MIEEIAGLFIVQCEECEHGYHLADDCPHLDEDICMWQRELAAEAHQKYIEDGYVQLADNQELPQLPVLTDRVTQYFGSGSIEFREAGYRNAQSDMTTPDKDGNVWKKVVE